MRANSSLLFVVSAPSIRAVISLSFSVPNERSSTSRADLAATTLFSIALRKSILAELASLPRVEIKLNTWLNRLVSVPD